MPDEMTPYAQCAEAEMTLRDRLAVDRTVLANERTFLAYIRTALAFFIVAGTLFKFFDAILSDVAGVVFAVTGGVLLGIGVWRYRGIQKKLGKTRRT